MVAAKHKRSIGLWRRQHSQQHQPQIAWFSAAPLSGLHVQTVVPHPPTGTVIVISGTTAASMNAQTGDLRIRRGWFPETEDERQSSVLASCSLHPLTSSLSKRFEATKNALVGPDQPGFHRITPSYPFLSAKLSLQHASMEPTARLPAPGFRLYINMGPWAMCLDARTGLLVWEHAYTVFNHIGIAAILKDSFSDRIFLAGQWSVDCLDARIGHRIWRCSKRP
ncbi:hypothetical protein DFJ73DRAFT_780502 [Zopfochytrium polystomum]|nr:hypothetical protein DFJ73DRAFT_780502 [Zopfochytrium polystomum]